MPFKLYNILSIFQIFINKTLRKYLDNFYTIYINNVFIYSKNKEDYKEYILKVLNKLRVARIYLDLTKYKFKTKKVYYFRLIFTINRLKIDLKKITTILEQQLL